MYICGVEHKRLGVSGDCLANGRSTRLIVTLIMVSLLAALLTLLPVCARPC